MHRHHHNQILSNASRLSEWENVPCRDNIKENSAEYSCAVAKLLRRSMEICEETLNLLCEIEENEYEMIRRECSHEWGKVCQSVAKYMCINHRLFWKVKNYSSTRNLVHNHSTRLIDLIYLLYLKCLLCAGGTRLFCAGGGGGGGARNHLAQLKAADIEYIRNDTLSISTRPISQYRINELMRAMDQLDHRWLQLHYSPQLVKYLQLLEYRLAELLCFIQDKQVLGFENWRKEVGGGGGGEERSGGGGGFVGNEKLLYRSGVRFINMNRSIYVYSCIPSLGRSELLIRLESRLDINESQLFQIRQRLDEYLQRSSQDTTDEILENSLSNTFMSLSCKQSEVELFKLKNTTGRTTILYNRNDPARILADCSSTTNCNRTINTSQLPARDMINLSLDKSSFAAPLVMFSMVEKAFMGKANVSFAKNLIFYRNYICCTFKKEHENLDTILDTNLPLAVQTFNHFKLCWNGIQYEINDCQELLSTILCILVKDHACRLQKQDLSRVMQVLLGKEWRQLMGLIHAR